MSERGDFNQGEFVARGEASRAEVGGFDISEMPIEARILFYNFLLGNQIERAMSVALGKKKEEELMAV